MWLWTGVWIVSASVVLLSSEKEGGQDFARDKLQGKSRLIAVAEILLEEHDQGWESRWVQLSFC